ncbi:MAG: MFS transporter [bacterium]
MAEAASQTSETSIAHSGIRAVLRNADFRWLWLSQVFSQTAGNMVTFVLILELYARTGSSFLTSILVVLTVLPTILFSSLAGIYADTFNRKYLLVTSNLVRSVLVVVLSILPTTPLLFCIFAFLLSAVSQFFGPAQSSAIPRLVRREELFSANTLFMFTTYASVLFGYTLAAPALHFLGEVRTASILVVAFTGSAFLNIRLPFFRDHLERQFGRSYLERAFGNLLSDIRKGLFFIRSSRQVLLLLLVVSLLFAFERALVGLLPNLATHVLGFNVDEIGYYLIAPAGVGAICASIFGRRLAQRIATFSLMLVGLLLAGIVLLPFPLVPFVKTMSGWHDKIVLFVALISFCSGVASIFVIVAGQTLLHELTPAETHGRAFGTLIASMNLIGLPLILVIGLLTDIVPLLTLIFVLGIVLTAAGLGAILFSRRPDPSMHDPRAVFPPVG